MNFKTNYLLPINIGITIFYLLFSTSCQKQAETEQERQEMIVGTWKTTVKRGTWTVDKSFTLEINFLKNGRYTSKRHGDSNVLYSDSIYYQIENDKLIFKGLGKYSGEWVHFSTQNISILKLTNEELTINDNYDEYDFDKK